MSKRKIIKIDLEKCNGCGLCIPNCPEGALQIIYGKARVISDLFCDGLGACIGHCPQGAITMEERDAKAYDEKKVMKNIVSQGRNVIKAHLAHLKEHNQTGFFNQAIEYLKEHGLENPFTEEPKPAHDTRTYVQSGCPASRAGESRLRQWPIQITLVSPCASYLEDSDLLIAADCVAFTYAHFHQDLLKGKTLLIGCPKLDDTASYEKKITEILKNNNVKSITYAHMEVPCCFGMVHVIESALKASGKEVPFKEVVIGIHGEKLQ